MWPFQDCLVLSLFENGPVVLERISNFVTVLSLFRYFLLGKGCFQTWIPFTKDALCQVWWNLVIKKEFFFKISSMYFRYFIIISPRKGRALHWNKLKSSSSNNALCQFWLKLWFWRRFLNFVNLLSPHSFEKRESS